MIRRRKLSLVVATLLMSLLGSGVRAQAACTPGVACGLQLNGSTYVTFGNTSALGLAQFTIETWFKRTGAGTSTSTGTGGIANFVPLVTKGRGEGDGSNVDENYLLGINTSGNVIAADFEEGAGGSSPGLNHPVSGVTPILDNVWYHAAATYDGATWRLYLNGNLEASLAVNQPTRADSIQHAGLGTCLNSTGGAAGFFVGILDEARIWNVARTQAEIQSAILLEIPSATNLVARWGLNEGTGTAVGDSAGTPQNGTITGAGYAWSDGSPFDINLAPAQPTLSAPANGAVDQSTSPTLDVVVTDPDGDPLTVTFWGRPKTTVPDFTYIALPDTQYYTSSLNGGSPAIFNSQTNWIVNNRVSRNIAFVSQLGDCTEHGDNSGDPVEWIAADAAMSIIENPLTTGLTDGIPYGITVGNHDQSPIGNPDGATTVFYNQYFGESRFLGRGYYGGHYGSNNDNHYQLFSASGMDFIVINLEYDTSPDTAILDWADALLKAYPNRRGILISHWFINTGNPGSFGAQGQATYDALKDNPNFFLMLAGHVPGEGRRQDTFSGSTVHSLLSDYQGRTNGGNGWLRILTFKPSLNQIQVQTYSPWLNQFETDADSQFTLSYDMGGAGFTQIAQVTGVASGQHATAVWAGLDPGVEYEWYVTANDGSATTTGPTWSFTTGDCGDGSVGVGEECDDGNAGNGDGCAADCTVESCYACVGAPSVCSPDNGAACNDGLYCNGADTCSGGACVVHAGSPCPGADADGDCSETCNEATDSCTANDPNGSPCNDGTYCNGADTCSGGSCSGHAGNPCPGADGDGDCSETCDETADSCTANDPNGSSCTDGAYCNGADTCSAGACAGHAGDPCAAGSECADLCNEVSDSCNDPAGTACADDSNGCTDDECNGSGACVHANNADSCDDGVYCNGADTCSGGACSIHGGDPCAGGGECADACNEAADTCDDPAGLACADDGNACTDDACDGLGTCAHANDDTNVCDDGEYCTVSDACAAGVCDGSPRDCSASGDQCREGTCNETTDQCDGPAKPDGTACNDDDDCTVPDTCAAGDCVGVPYELACLDHFNCYKSKTTAGFTAVSGMGLVDAFWTSTAEAKKPKWLCAPADKNDEDPTAPSHPDHLESYQIKPTTKFAGAGGIVLQDPLGTTTVALTKPANLLVPTAKSLSAPPTAPLAPIVDHFQCYKVKVTTSNVPLPALGISVQDQFGQLTSELRKLKYACVPVNKNGEEPGAETNSGYLTCYQQKSTPKFEKKSPVFAANQFGAETMDVIKPFLFCMPAARLP